MKSASWLMVVTGCALVAVGLGYYKYRQIQAGIAYGASFPEPVEAVEAAIVREELWQPTTAVTGDVRAIQSVDVSTELAGRIVEVGFAPGAAVSQGQLRKHAALDNGGTVSVTVDSAAGEHMAPGRIIARDALLSERSRNVSFRAPVDNSPRSLYPGMLVGTLFTLPSIYLLLASTHRPETDEVSTGTGDAIEPASDGEPRGAPEPSLT